MAEDPSNAPAPTPPPLPPVFLDAPMLLGASEPQGQTPWFWYGIGALGLLVLLTAMGATQEESARQTIDAVALVILAGLMFGSLLLTRLMVRRHRRVAGTIAAAEELMQLRRWEPAGIILQNVLSQPAPSPRLRTQALALLASLLIRYGRFEEAIAVCNELLEHEGPGRVDEVGAFGLRLVRAMAMLREDHLVDADRAMSEMRRRYRTVEREDGDGDSPGALALVDIYRDVKTGHPREAIELINRRLPVMRRQLGHRVADAYALLARAHDLVGETTAAAAAYAKATLLAPAVELHRRYPEVAAMAGKYPVAVAPKEAL